TVETAFRRSRAGALASLLPLVAGPDIERVVLSWPDFVDLPTQPLVNYLLIPRRDDVRDEMHRLFGPDLEGWYVGSTADGPPSGSSPRWVDDRGCSSSPCIRSTRDSGGPPRASRSCATHSPDGSSWMSSQGRALLAARSWPASSPREGCGAWPASTWRTRRPCLGRSTSRSSPLPARDGSQS